MYDIGVVTNAHAARQLSMNGYGQLALDVARTIGRNVTEFRPTSWLSNKFRGDGISRKLVLNADRFVLTPTTFIGQRAFITHVIDPGNILYLDVIRHDASIVTVHDMIPHLCEAGILSGF